MWCSEHWDGKENNYSRAIFEIIQHYTIKKGVFTRCGKSWSCNSKVTKKKKKVPICRSVFWPAAQVTVRTRFTVSRHGAADMQTLLSVNVWAYFACGGCNGRFASGSRCSRLPASIMTTRDDVCDTGGEEGSCREQGCRSLITDRWHENTHTQI